MSPDDKLSDWASHAVAPDEPPAPSPEHIDSADGALTKLFGDEVRIDAEPVTGPQPLVNLESTPIPEAAPFDDGVAERDRGGAPDGPDDGRDDGSDDQRSARDRRKDWRRTEKARRLAARQSVRFPIFTRSILLWMLIFALVGVAFGASGAFFWANFNSRVSDIEQSQDDFESRSLDAQADIERLKEETLQQIGDASAPARAIAAESQMLQLAQIFSPSVYEVATFDDEGLASAGAAFAVIDDGDSTFFVTSYTTVKAATVDPGPPLVIRKDGEEVRAEVWSWDPDRDLALIKAPRADVPLLDWFPTSEQAGLVGSRIFPVSGTGGAGASLTAGSVIDQSASGFRHTAPLDPTFQGGPIVDVDGKVVGVASLTYAPLGFDTGPQIHAAIPIDEICQRLISCGGGTRSPGTQGG